MNFPTYPFKQLFSGGLLCCLILLATYLFQAFFPEMYVDAFSSSMYFLMWLILFVGVLLWTFHVKGERIIGISKVIVWQFIAAFILITADEIYMIMPKEVHMGTAPVLSSYTIPILVVGIMIAVATKISVMLYQKLAGERRQAVLQTQKIQQLLDSPPIEHKDVLLFRKLIENRSIAQLSARDYLLLVEECRMIDPEFFTWLEQLDCHLPPRDIVLCVLIRMYKTKEEILSIFCITDGTYRTMKSRVRKRLSIDDKELEAFLREAI